MSVIWVNSIGTAFTRYPYRWRLEDERRSCAAVLERATPQEGASPEIPIAPARGACRTAVPTEAVMTPSGPRVYADRSSGLRVHRLDAWDRMHSAARRSFPARLGRWEAERRAKGLPVEGRGVRRPVFVPPFTVGQVEMGRDYAALVERLAASGVRCCSLERTGRGGPGTGLSVSEAVSRDMARLRVLERRVGAGVVKDCMRPSKGGMRSTIRVADLVRSVCVEEMTLAEVARRHGWAKNGRIVEILKRELAGALERMRGFGLAVPRETS
ncbi:hypothetical protein [Sagittula stellata]|uniref:Uncharacterized protein n=1 Tax=Sagittula stellata (strain ATCC 700073 / DSM 11524 / E-37) TaxID=388399 RepID=A3K1Z1_SAGS3|nr:hypothetical protein [Sagittula stellata]EBA08937.1 hypothetical protein SSE37_04805 [Sagittula stellata E-37]